MIPVPPVSLFPLSGGVVESKVGGFVVAVLIGLAMYAASKQAGAKPLLR